MIIMNYAILKSHSPDTCFYLFIFSTGNRNQKEKIVTGNRNKQLEVGTVSVIWDPTAEQRGLHFLRNYCSMENSFR